MRILYVHAPGASGSYGGIQTYGTELARGMREREHEVLELSVDPQAILAGALDVLPRRPYWHPEFLWRRGYYQDFRYHQAVQKEVEAAARRFEPELLHVLHVYQLGALEAATVPSVVTCHGLELNEGSLVRQSIHRASAVHCNSQFTARYLASMQPDAPEPTILRWGVQAVGQALQTDPPDFDLITVSRLVPRKNIVTVLLALRQRPALRYAIVGGGPERESLQRLAQGWGLSNVFFLGEVTEEEKWSALARSRAFILAPRNDLDLDVEGLGLVYYEAFAAGLPVVAARSGGVPEAVGEGGVLLEDPLDVVELGRAIDTLMDPASRAVWEKAVQQRRDEDSWSRYLERFEEFYRRQIAANSR